MAAHNYSAALTYKQQQARTSSPGELTLMLYNGLVKFLKIGLQEMEDCDYEKVNSSLLRGQEILNELRMTLDMKYEIAKSMDALYEYMNRRIIESNLKKDEEILKEVIGFAEEFRDTWAHALKLVK